jgi:hypothetical protein
MRLSSGVQCHFLYFFKAGFLFHPRFYPVKEALLPGVICKVQLYVHS